METKTRLCPRCKEPRMIEWFGDPKAPYAICYKCRAEVRAERKAEQEQERYINNKCVICGDIHASFATEICSTCHRGIEAFQRSAKLLSRAASFVNKSLRRPHKQAKKFKRQNKQVRELIQSQRADARETRLRFERAIEK